MFYIFPLFSGPTDTIGMVVLILIATFILSIVVGLILKEKIKYLYSLIVSLMFIPSVYIYYNESALIHSVWYFVISCVGILIGVLIRFVVKELN